MEACLGRRTILGRPWLHSCGSWISGYGFSCWCNLRYSGEVNAIGRGNNSTVVDRLVQKKLGKIKRRCFFALHLMLPSVKFSSMSKVYPSTTHGRIIEILFCSMLLRGANAANRNITKYPLNVAITVNCLIDAALYNPLKCRLGADRAR